MQQKEKKRDWALLLLLLLLLFIAGTIVYYGTRPHKAAEKPAVKLPEKRRSMYLDEPMLTDSVGQASDSGGYSGVTTPATASAAETAAVTGTPVAAAPEMVPTVEKPVKAIENLRNNKSMVDLSPDKDMIVFYDPVKKNLHFYPATAEWDKVYLIYPSPDKKGVLRRNLIYPDYEGMIHPLYRKGNVSYNGSNKEAVSVKINSKASRDRGYIIQARTDPEYFIFGDYEDRNRWYIYENGKVRKFKPADDLDAGIVEKL